MRRIQWPSFGAGQAHTPACAVSGLAHASRVSPAADVLTAHPAGCRGPGQAAAGQPPRRPAAQRPGPGRRRARQLQRPSRISRPADPSRLAAGVVTPDGRVIRALAGDRAHPAGRRWPATAPDCRRPQGRQATPAAAASPRSGGRGLCARIRGVVVVPGRCARLRHRGGGQLAVARLRGQPGDRRDLGYLQRRAAGDLGLGRVLVAEVRE